MTPPATGSDTPRVQPGAVIVERFEVEREAGRGGMGAVFRARDLLGGGLVALKVLSEPADEAARRTFLTRVPHIVRIAELHRTLVVRD